MKVKPKYANAAIAKEDSLKEFDMYEEASQISEWIKAMKEEINTLEKKSNLGSSGKAKICKTQFLQIGIQDKNLSR